MLVDLGADVHAETYNEETPLHSAAEKGHIEAIKVLVELGADVHAESAYKLTALDLAEDVEGDRGVETVKVLKEMEAYATVSDFFRRFLTETCAGPSDDDSVHRTGQDQHPGDLTI